MNELNKPLWLVPHASLGTAWICGGHGEFGCTNEGATAKLSPYPSSFTKFRRAAVDPLLAVATSVAAGWFMLWNGDDCHIPKWVSYPVSILLAVLAYAGARWCSPGRK